MHLHLTIMLDPNESVSTLSGDATEIASKILIAAGGDPANDSCLVSISTQTTGSIGLPEPLPETLPEG